MSSILSEADREIVGYISKGPHLTIAGGVSEARGSTRAIFESLGISTYVWEGDSHKYRDSLQKSYGSKGFIVHVAEPLGVGASSEETDTMHRLIWQQNWAASQKVPNMDFLSVTPSKGEVIQCLRLASEQWTRTGVQGGCVRVSYFATCAMLRLFDLLARKRSRSQGEQNQSGPRSGAISPRSGATSPRSAAQGGTQHSSEHVSGANKNI